LSLVKEDGFMALSRVRTGEKTMIEFREHVQEII